MSPTDTPGAGSSPTGNTFSDAFSGPQGRRRLRNIQIVQTGDTPMAVSVNHNSKNKSTTEQLNAAPLPEAANLEATIAQALKEGEKQLEMGQYVLELRDGLESVSKVYVEAKKNKNKALVQSMQNAARVLLEGCDAMGLNSKKVFDHIEISDEMKVLLKDTIGTSTALRVLKTLGKVALVGTGVGAVGALGYYGYKRFFGDTAPVVEVTVAE